MKSILYRFSALVATLVLCASVSAFALDGDACTTLLKNKKWSKASSQIGAGSKGNLQGSAFLPASLNGIDGKDRIYCFKQDSKKAYNSYDYYEPSTGTWTIGSDQFTWGQPAHMGSVSFGPKVVESYTGSDGVTYTCHIPFAYASGHCFLDAQGNVVADGTAGATKYITSVVMDLENGRLVKLLAFPNRQDDCILAYDWGTPDAQGNYIGKGCVWVIGYQQNVVGMSPYVIDEYRNVDMTDFLAGNPTRWNYSDITPQTIVYDNSSSSSFVVPQDGSPYCLRATVGGPDSDGIQKTLECGTVQDAFYHDNHLYVVTGRGTLYNRTEFVKVHCFYATEGGHDYDKTIVAPLHGESQGLVFDGTNIWMTLIGNNIGESGLYKLSPRATGDMSYDNLNFQEPKRISGTDDNDPAAVYSITNGYELGWFLMQVYAGRTQISCQLANDIDLMGITLPTTYYVYEKDGDNGHKFEAQYAFRGSFDGNNHKISNLAINQTPFYNDGLFPYVIGATIQNVTVSGSITLTKADNNNGALGNDIENVGFIGNAEGECTITGVDVTDFAISNPSNLSVANVNELCGNSNGKDYTIGNTFKKDHETEGVHSYNENGICKYKHASEDGLYEPAKQDANDVYQIANAGNLIWFAKGVTAGTVSTSANAKLTANINLEGAKFGSFPMIGSASKVYTGTFDGNGKSIENFFLTVTANTSGMFAAIGTNAVIKDFSLHGDMTVTNSTDKYFVGAVVGKADGNSLVQDVTSYVNITVDGRVRSGMGGVVGVTVANQTAVVNRCRYSGTITVAATTSGTTAQGIGGVIGNHRCGTVKNCLFDGTIITTVDDTNSNANLNVGGLCGATSDNGNAKFNNCFAHGTLEIQDNTYGHCGIFIGSAAGTTTVTNCYYTDNNVSVAKGSVLVSAAGEPQKVSKQSALTDNTILYKLQNGEVVTTGYGNWTAGAEYPIPVVGPLVEKPAHTHSFDITGFCDEGDGGMQKPETEDGYFKLVNRGNLWWFLNYVNGTLASDDPDKGTHASACAKLGKNIDMEENTWAGFNNFAGKFDGQGHTISGFKASYTSGNKHGFFNNTLGASTTNMAEIRNLVMEGEVTLNGNFAFTGAVLGSADQNTLVEDVTSKATINIKSGNERYVGGVVGCLLKNTTSVNRCRYSGTTTVEVAYKSPRSYRQGVGGIVGASRLGTVSNCIFDGKMISKTDNNNVAGILGTASDGIRSYVKNCLSVGTFELVGNSSGLCGAIFGACHSEQQGGSVTVSDCYACATGISDLVGTSQDYISKTTTERVASTTADALVNGETCALLNANSGQWSQVLGYQVGLNKTSGSPAQANPMPGTQYPVTVSDGNYTIGYLYLDDAGDATPMPTVSDGKTIKAKKISYKRAGTYMTNGFVSVCMPFALDENSLPGGNACKVKLFAEVKTVDDANYVYFKDAETIEAGVPYFLYLPESMRGQQWSVELSDNDGIAIVAQPANPETGILGSFTTALTGAWSNEAPMYKIKSDGETLVKTTANSHCYPYRAYLKLPAIPSGSSASEYRLSFEDYATSIETVEEAKERGSRLYNLMGQPIEEGNKGLMIRSGKIILTR